MSSSVISPNSYTLPNKQFVENSDNQELRRDLLAHNKCPLQEKTRRISEFFMHAYNASLMIDAVMVRGRFIIIHLFLKRILA